MGGRDDSMFQREANGLKAMCGECESVRHSGGVAGGDEIGGGVKRHMVSIPRSPLSGSSTLHIPKCS